MNYENLGYSLNKYLACLALSLITVFSFGIDIISHQIYNLSEFFYLKNGIVTRTDFHSFDNSPFNPLYYYRVYIVPILEYGIIYLSLSILVRWLAILMIYDIVRNFASKNISILITTSFLLAYNSASHGLIVNGMWLESGFYPASLSAIGILAGIRFLFKESNILAGFAFAFSIIAHQLYGITALAFIFPGLIFNYYESSKKGKLLNLIKVFLPSLFVIFYHFYFRSLIDVNIEITHSFLEWYKFTVLSDPDDVTILSSFEYYGFGLIPLLLVGLHLSLKGTAKSQLERFTLGASMMSLLFVIIEIMHLQGFFIETFSFSEFFIASQFRRGLWVACLFSWILIIKNLFQFMKDDLSDKSRIFMTIAIISIYVFPSFLAVLLMALVLSLYFKSYSSVVLLVCTFLSSVIYYSSSVFDFSWQNKVLGYSIIFASLTGLLFFILSKRVNMLSNNISVAVLIVLSLFYFANGINKNTLIQNISIMTTNGLLEKTDQTKLMIKYPHLQQLYSYDEGVEKCILSRPEKFKDEQLQTAISGPRNTYIALYPKEPFFKYHNPMFSRIDFESSLNKLRIFFGVSTVENFLKKGDYKNKKEINDYFLDAYATIPKLLLQEVRDHHALRYYLLESKREDLIEAEICKGDIYYVYDLTLL